MNELQIFNNEEQRVCTEEERQMLRERLKTNRAKGRKGSNFDSDGLKV